MYQKWFIKNNLSIKSTTYDLFSRFNKIWHAFFIYNSMNDEKKIKLYQRRNKIMTIKDLIQELKKYDENKEVYMDNVNEEVFRVSGVYELKDGISFEIDDYDIVED